MNIVALGLYSGNLPNGKIIYIDPKFADLGHQNPPDFHLKDGSPAIGAGIWHKNMPLYDIEGKEYANPPNLGAYA